MDIDRFGFFHPEDSKASNALFKLQRTHFETLHVNNEELQREIIDSYLHKKGINLDQLVKTKELKFIIRHGISLEYRAKFWWNLSGGDQIFQEGYYNQMVKQYEGMKSTHTQQIDLVRNLLAAPKFDSRQPFFPPHQDILRTLPTNVAYCSAEAPGIDKLRRLLIAYSWRNPVIGYCQGMNMLAGIFLLVLEEEQAFWAFTAMVENIMPPDYFTSNLIQSQADQRVLRELVIEKFPRLIKHLEANGVELGLITFNWFLTAFVECVPPEVNFFHPFIFFLSFNLFFFFFFFFFCIISDTNADMGLFLVRGIESSLSLRHRHHQDQREKHQPTRRLHGYLQLHEKHDPAASRCERTCQGVFCRDQPVPLQGHQTGAREAPRHFARGNEGDGGAPARKRGRAKKNSGRLQ